jgi:hypothetical protein
MYPSRKAELQQFSRRKATVFGKSEELAGLCNADVLSVVRKDNRFYIYSSGDMESMLSELVC